MSSSFSPVSLGHLLQLILYQLDKGHYFGIPEQLFQRKIPASYITYPFGRRLEIPLGVAAGPHTQLAQNIVGAWICGARYIELKTVQTLDKLEVSKPCIDMQDEGYNCEWSQELRIRESFDQYLNAWIIIHILQHKFFNDFGKETGTIFNMSLGYDLQGVMQENVQWFLEKMNNCKTEKEEKLASIHQIYPESGQLDIPDCISDNITLSTMHGCPPEEIESIASYLIVEKKLHSIIKLNPTLLGSAELRKILNFQLGFQAIVPDSAFEHDLKYEAAVSLINKLSRLASENNRFFGIKLTNTLECLNFKNIFPEKEKMMYLSGRALHPVSIALAFKLQQEFNGKLNISFSAGADCFNLPALLGCGLSPVTVCSDLLKPGGYGRLSQYLEEAEKEFPHLEIPTTEEARLERLGKYAAGVIRDKRYHKTWTEPDIKTTNQLSFFDCIHAPCTCTCPSSQDIPSYLYYAARGEYDKAFEVILRNNPFPSVTGLVCDHLCQTKCTRVHYDEAIRIRDVKYFITRQQKGDFVPVPEKSNGLKVAVVGAGPSGLSCAWFLQLAGCAVTVYEEKSRTGGMVSSVIPAFRLPEAEIDHDIQRIRKTGIDIRLNSVVDRTFFSKLQQESDYIYIATGAKLTKKLNLPGADNKSVLDPISFLADIKMGKPVLKGSKIVVIGGGNTALDTARTAKRVVKSEGVVTVLYRRSLKDMPAGKEEIQAAREEGVVIAAFVSPVEVLVRDNGISGIRCRRCREGEIDASGRPVPVEIEGSEFIVEADIIIPALGQNIADDFMKMSELKGDQETGITTISNVFIGGDARRGASSVIKAIADGRKSAMFILQRIDKRLTNRTCPSREEITGILVSKARKRKLPLYPESKIDKQLGFDWVPPAMDEKFAIEESAACLACDVICNNCVSVCPNFANYSYQVTPLTLFLHKAVRNGNSMKLEEDKPFMILQSYQILHLADFCNGCGNCNTFCPTDSAPYLEKPSLFFSSEEYNKAEKGFILRKSNKGNTLYMKTEGGQVSLTDLQDYWKYETGYYSALLDKATLLPQDIQWKTAEVQEAVFTSAAVMTVLFSVAVSLHS